MEKTNVEYSLSNEELRQWYRERGFGGRVGFGERPAVLVIDVAKLWLDPTTPQGSEQDAVVKQICAVLNHARAAAVPIIFTTMGFERDMSDAGTATMSKIPQSAFEVLNSDATELDPRLERRESELLIEKRRGSAFFGTPLVRTLIDKAVDTLIITGLSTSGCIRATCESALDYNYRAIVPAEAVGDRCELSHEANLFEIDNRFADVVSVGEVLDYLDRLHA